MSFSIVNSSHKRKREDDFSDSAPKRAAVQPSFVQELAILPSLLLPRLLPIVASYLPLSYRAFYTQLWQLDSKIVNIESIPWDHVVSLDLLESLGSGSAHHEPFSLSIQKEFMISTICSRYPRIERIEYSGGSATDAALKDLSAAVNLHTLQCISCPTLSPKGIEALSQIQTLESLHFFRCRQVTGRVLASLSLLPQLTHLNLECFEGCVLGDEGLLSISKIKRLERLLLWNCTGITPLGFACLTALREITSLFLSSCTDIGDQSLRSIGQLTTLQELTLIGCSDELLEQITDRGFSAIGNLSDLETLWLDCGPKLTPSSFTWLSSLDRLRELHLFGKRRVIDDLQFSCFAIQSLRALRLHKMLFMNGEGLSSLLSLALECLEIFKCRELTDQGLKIIGQLLKLKRLTITGSPEITDLGLSYLSPLSALEELNFSECPKITGKGISSFEHSSLLQFLNLNDCFSMTDAALVKLPPLRTLYLRNCQITDDGVRTLTRYPSLVSLDLTGCRVTDRGLLDLLALENLSSLYIERNLSITPLGVQQFLTQHKGISDLLVEVSSKFWAEVMQPLIERNRAEQGVFLEQERFYIH